MKDGLIGNNTLETTKYKSRLDQINNNFKLNEFSNVLNKYDNTTQNFSKV